MSEFTVVYESKTGNTEKIAAAIYQALPGISKDIFPVSEQPDTRLSRLLFIGFPVERGSLPQSVSSFLAALHNKSIAIFCTGGHTRGNAVYDRQVEQEARHFIAPDNEYLGFFICQGKMPISVRQLYEKQYMDSPSDKHVLKRIYDFDNAMLHPGRADEEHAAQFALDALSCQSAF